jgi:hypothetical protein
MPSIGLLLLFSIAAAWMCIKSRAAGPASVFSALALVFFVSTPIGSGLPDAIGSLFSTMDHATTPALNREVAATR